MFAPPRPVTQATIQQALAPLIGLPLRRIGRAADMLWMEFGDLRELPDHRGGTRTAGEWALHVQCPWRITRPPTILIGRRDCFYQAGSDEPYDWDAGGESRFDRCAAPINRDFQSSPPQVEAVVVDAVGGFTLRLAAGYISEVFPDESTGSDSEHWRFFRAGRNERHFVFPSIRPEQANHALQLSRWR